MLNVCRGRVVTIYILIAYERKIPTCFKASNKVKKMLKEKQQNLEVYLKPCQTS